MFASLSSRRLPAYTAIFLISVVAAILLGKDINWDLLNYHTYAGFSVLEDRLMRDYFAAGPHSYLNPYSHVPFYLLLRSEIRPEAIAGVLALFHALNLVIAYELARFLNRRADGQIAWLGVWLGVFFVFTNPVFLTELGGTFNEISTSVMVLGGWYVLVREFSAPRPAYLVLAGALIGAAVALKLTNVYFSVTALPLLLCAPIGLRQRLLNVLVFGLGGMLGALAAGGYWALQMWEMFGNPMFPLFNHIFQSPEFTAAQFAHTRFLPETFAEAALRPFVMATPWSAVHIENMAPDLRYIFLLLLAGALGVIALRRRFARGTAENAATAPAFLHQRALGALAAGLVLSWLFWLFSSGNSRYFLAMGCIAGIVLPALLLRITANRRFITYAAVFMVVFQAGLVFSSGTGHWTTAGWGKSWFEVEVAPALQQEASLYLNTDAQAPSFLMPYLPRAASLMTITGVHVLNPNDRTRALMDKYRGNIRVMRRVASEDARPAGQLNYALVRFGLEADMSNCQMVKTLMRDFKTGETGYWYYIFCKTRPLSWSAEKLAHYAAEKQRASRVFDKLELLCPSLFAPRGLATEGDGNEFWRNYAHTDIALARQANGVVAYVSQFRDTKVRDIGALERLEQEMPAKARLCP